MPDNPPCDILVCCVGSSTEEADNACTKAVTEHLEAKGFEIACHTLTAETPTKDWDADLFDCWQAVVITAAGLHDETLRNGLNHILSRRRFLLLIFTGHSEEEFNKLRQFVRTESLCYNLLDALGKVNPSALRNELVWRKCESASVALRVMHLRSAMAVRGLSRLFKRPPETKLTFAERHFYPEGLQGRAENVLREVEACSSSLRKRAIDPSSERAIDPSSALDTLLTACGDLRQERLTELESLFSVL
jgi:hypothetical protein